MSGPSPAVLLTRNEARAAEHAEGRRLAIVTSALVDPTPLVVDGPTALAGAEAFVYRVDLTNR